MKSKYSRFQSSSTHGRFGAFTKTFGLSLGLAVAVLFTQSAHATTYNWNIGTAGSQTWDLTGNWNVAGFPNAVSDVANFTNVLAGGQTITLGQAITIGSSTIGAANETADSFTIGANGGNAITMNNGGGGATITFGDGAGNSVAAPLIIADAGGLTITNTGSLSRTKTVSGGITGTGNLTLTDNRTAGGTSQFNISTGSIDSIGTLTVNANATAGTAMTINSIIGSNLTSFTKNGTATLNLNGANTYTGGTVVNLGTLSIGAAGTLGNTAATLAVNNTNLGAGSNVVLNLTSGAVDTTTGSLSGTIATPSSGTNTAQINIRGTNRTFTVNQTTAGTFAGVIAGSGHNFTLGSSSTNTLTLSGANTYTGATTINAGALNVTGALNGTGAVAVNGGATLKGSGTIAGAVTVAAGNTAPSQGTVDLTNGSAGTLTLGSALTIGGAGSGLVSNLKFDVGATADSIALGAGIFTVDTGGANISITNSGGLAAGQTYNLITFTNSAGTGFATGTGTTVGSLTLTNPTLGFGVTGVLTVTSSAVQLVTSGAATPGTAYWKGSKGATWAANSGGTGNFTTDAAGTTFVQAYPGATTNVIFSATGASNFTNTLGQPFAVNSVTFTSASAVTINADSNTLTVGTGGLVVQGAAGAVSIGANLAGAGAVTNAGTLTLSGTNSFTGGIVNTGTLTAGSTSAFAGNDLAANAGTVNLNGNSNSVGLLSVSSGAIITNSATGTATLTTNTAFDSTIAGVLQDGGVGKVLSLTKAGIGTLTLTGSNAYSGTTTVLAGGLGIGNNSALGTSALTLGGSGSITPTIFASGGARSISGNILLDVQTTGNATLGGANDLTVNGTVTGNGSRTLTIGNTGVTTLAGSVFLMNDNTTTGRTLTINGTNLTISGAIANNNVGNTVAAGLAYGGSGTLILSGNNTYTGNTNLASGILQLQSNGGNTPVSTANVLGIGGTLSISSGTTVQLRGDTTGVTFAGFNNTGLGNAASVTLDVNRLSSGSGATLGVNGFAVQNSTINVTGGNGYTLSMGSMGESLAANGTAHATTFNPTTANVTLGSLSSTGGTGGTSTMNWVLDGTAGSNFATGVINNGQSQTRLTSVTKSNSSTWTLTGVNTYQGSTTVNGGTLSITHNNTLANSSSVYVVTGAFLDLNFTGTDTVTSFYIDGVLQATGEWGSTGSGAAHETARITGTGRINATGTSAYGSWATSKGLTGTNNGATQDPENDGMANLLEFVLNGDPLVSDTSILPVQSDDGTYFIFTFNRADASLTEVTLTFEYGPDLTSWTPIAIPTAATGIPVNITDGVGTDQVQVKVLKSSVAGGKLFGRLHAVK